jgi:hypothetical protein
MDMISSRFSLKFDCNVISAESAKDMLFRREEANVMNVDPEQPCFIIRR